MTSMKKGLLSTILSILGIILVIMSYSISEKPTSGEKAVIRIFFFLGITSMIMSILLGILGIKSKEKGFLKYTGMLIIALLILGLLLFPLLMGIFGFREP